MIALVLLAFAAGCAYVLYARQLELFSVSVRAGKALVIRGDCPDALFSDIQDVVRRAEVERATIRATKTEHHARLIVSGTDDRVAQRLRNVFGSHPIHLRRDGGAPNVRRNLGQILGIAWLAWLLTDRTGA